MNGRQADDRFSSLFLFLWTLILFYGVSFVIGAFLDEKVAARFCCYLFKKTFCKEMMHTLKLNDMVKEILFCFRFYICGFFVFRGWFF